MDVENGRESASQMNFDEITKSFQREAEALREILRARDLQIKALKAHSLCLRQNFKTILEAILDKFADNDIQYHARRMIDEIDQAGVAVDKIDRGQS